MENFLGQNKGNISLLLSVGFAKTAHIYLPLTLLLLNTTCPFLANSVDPDQLASDLDLHCLPLSM